MTREFRRSAVVAGSATAAGSLAALPDGVRDADDPAVYIVRDVEDVAVCDRALHGVVVEQRPGRIAAQDERQLPREVVAVVQPRVHPLPAERAREVGGVADQETLAVRQAGDDPPVHPERREPGDVGGSTPPTEPYLGACGDVFVGYRLYPIFQVLESEPAPARERREQHHAVRAAEEATLVARYRSLHRDVSDEEMALVGGALEWVAHRVACDAVRPTRTDDDAGVDRLDAAVSVHELDEDAVRIRVHLRRRDPPLDHAAERREMGLEDPLGLVLREAALNSQRQSIPSKSRPLSSDMSGPYTRTRRTCSAASRNGGSRPTESRISRVPGWIAVARASWCDRASCSMSRASTPWRASSAAANSPEGPAPMIKTSLRAIRHPRKPATWDRSLANHHPDRRQVQRLG
jgi:hypothetical protein